MYIIKIIPYNKQRKNVNVKGLKWENKLDWPVILE